MFDDLKSAALISLQKVEEVTDFDIDGLTDLRVAHDKVANTGMYGQFKKNVNINYDIEKQSKRVCN